MGKAELRPAGRPTGREATWAALRDLHRRSNDDFTVLEIAFLARVPSSTARNYLERLVRAGILSKTPGSLAPRPFRGLFRLARDLGVEAPDVNRDGELVQAITDRARLWAAMKAMPSFGEQDLCVALGLEKPEAARGYLRRLERAGYLAVVEPGWRPGARRRWRLLPAMNTGPRPPSIRRGGAVVDTNTGRQMWPVP